MVTFLGSLVQSCCGEGGTLQTNITGVCGECSQCLGHTPFKDNGLPFWVPDVLCHHSEVVLWNLLSIQMFSNEFVEDKVVSPSYSSVILGPPLQRSHLDSHSTQEHDFIK